MGWDTPRSHWTARGDEWGYDMCGSAGIGSTPTLATTPTGTLAGGGAITSTTPPASPVPAVPTAATGVAGVSGGGALPDSIAPLLAQINTAVAALQQALAGGSLGGGPGAAPTVGGGGDAMAGCDMMGGGPPGADPTQGTPTQAPPTKEPTAPPATTPPTKHEHKAKKHKHKAKAPTTPPAPPAKGGGANAAPPTPAPPAAPPTDPNAGQRAAIDARIADLTKQRKVFEGSGGADAVAYNRLTELITAEEKKKAAQ